MMEIPMRRMIEGLITAAVLAGSLLAQEKLGQESDGVARRVEEFRFVPVRVHLFRSEVMTIGTTLTRTDIERIFRKANEIWHAAGIHLWVESIVEDKPEGAAAHESDTTFPLNALESLRPAESLAQGMFHVYYLRSMPVNGIYKGRDAIFVQQVARLREVPGGIDEPLPRVSSHELGHAMGLPHRQAMTNLMASGTTGTGLNEDEIMTARTTAEKFSWTDSTDGFLKKADVLAEAGKKEEATSRYKAIADLPGNSPLKDRAKAHITRVLGALPRITFALQDRGGKDAP